MNNLPTEMLRLTPEALSRDLDQAGLSLKDFCSRFGVGYETAKRWALPDTNPRAIEPPYWITPVLGWLARDPDFREFVDNTRAENVAEADHAD